VTSATRPNDPHEMPRWRYAARAGLYSIRVAGPRANHTTWVRTTPKVRGKAARRGDRRRRRLARDRQQRLDAIGVPLVRGDLVVGKVTAAGDGCV